MNASGTRDMGAEGSRTEPVARRLSAIVAADVVGYSRLMEQDEEGTLTRLKAHLRDLVDPCINKYRGRIVKRTGDGVLVEFASVIEAVQCATEVQTAMAGSNAHVSSEKRIEFRIGVNLGDVIIDEGDVFGDAVNVACRLQALAEPGGICVSKLVSEQIREKLPVALIDHRERSVKNIARPIHFFPSDSVRAATLLHAGQPMSLTRRRAFRSLSCPSPISATTRTKHISLTAWSRI
jgi:adenylate cyclase